MNMADGVVSFSLVTNSSISFTSFEGIISPLLDALSSAGFTSPHYLSANGGVHYQSVTYIPYGITVLQNAVHIGYINIETGQPSAPDVAISVIDDIVTEL